MAGIGNIQPFDPIFAHLWDERFEDNATDLVALQNEITSRIAVADRLCSLRQWIGQATAYPIAPAINNPVTGCCAAYCREASRFRSRTCRDRRCPPTAPVLVRLIK